MSANLEQLPEIITAPRTDAIYNCHSYLTKVPIAAIQPFIEAFTEPGEVVADFALEVDFLVQAHAASVSTNPRTSILPMNTNGWRQERRHCSLCGACCGTCLALRPLVNSRRRLIGKPCRCCPWSL